MAVGKGSMERASRAMAKPAEIKKTEEPVKVAEKTTAKPELKKASAKTSAPKEKAPEKKTAAKKTATKKPTVKKATPAKTVVIEKTDEQVMNKIVYQSSDQILDRDALPNESFYVGDSMPIYLF